VAVGGYFFTNLEIPRIFLKKSLTNIYKKIRLARHLPGPHSSDDLDDSDHSASGSEVISSSSFLITLSVVKHA
jgi:hypothetical protein